jgi:hypothetical protein
VSLIPLMSQGGILTGALGEIGCHVAEKGLALLVCLVRRRATLHGHICLAIVCVGRHHHEVV